MKKILLFILFSAFTIFSQSENKYVPLNSPQTGFINDLVLIYQGGTHRMEWNEAEFSPYTAVYDSLTKAGNWLFDGFLFIEFKDGKGHEFAHGYGNKPARKVDWLWLLKRNFERNKGLDALDRTISSFIYEIGVPPSKRKVVLTLPEPIINQEDWGAVDGDTLIFNNNDARINACRWFIETALNMWKEFNPHNLELAGFYWVAEYGSEAAEVIPAVAKIIKDAGKKFYWIPYWKAPLNSDWEMLGFDAAYQQPNHFFHPELPDERIDLACQFAAEHNMGLEMEFDKRMISDSTNYYGRFWSYINSFEKNDVWKNSAVAYYEGGGAIYALANSNDKNLRRAYNKLVEIIIKRQQE